jgi:hypothetical protein
MCQIHDMFQHAAAFSGTRHPAPPSGGDLTALLETLARCSTRPRYAFMLLTLIAELADSEGSAGPLVRSGEALVPLRDWLCDALTPMGQRDPRRHALAERVRAELAAAGTLPPAPEAAATAIEAELRQRVRASGKTNLSRAVSELVAAGLLRRHYQGFRVDHPNRGAQRQAVYTLTGLSRALISGRKTAPRPRAAGRQGELAFT